MRGARGERVDETGEGGRWIRFGGGRCEDWHVPAGGVRSLGRVWVGFLWLPAAAHLQGAGWEQGDCPGCGPEELAVRELLSSAVI